MRTFTTSVALLAAALASPALAASDGTLGPTSTGTFTVQASISADAADDVHIYGLEDFAFSGNEGGTIDGQAKIFCMIRTPDNGDVDVTITSFDAADTYFRVRTPGGADEVQMLLNIFSSITAQFYLMTEGTPETIPVEDNCNEAGTPQFQLSISLLNTATANPGNYSGSFLVTVAPN